MKPLTEQEIRAIVKDEIQKNYKAGSPMIPPHSHNDTDNLAINPVDLVGWSAIPVSTQKYLNESTGLTEYGFGSPQILAGGDSAHISQFVNNTSTAMYQIPVVVGNGVGAQSAFEGGWAPEGTLVFFLNGSISYLYIRVDGMWRGVNFNATA